MTKMAAIPIYVKNLKNLLLQNKQAADLESWYAASGARILPSLFKWLPWVDPDLFYGKVKFGPYAFVWEKGKTMDFLETIVVYDFKLATDYQNDKKFLFTSKLCPWRMYAPCPGAIYIY